MDTATLIQCLQGLPQGVEVKRPIYSDDRRVVGTEKITSVEYVPEQHEVLLHSTRE